MFNTVEELKDALCEAGMEDAVVFDGDIHYASAVIGYDMSGDNEHVVYDYDKMVAFLVEHCEMSYEEAIEWIDYNTLRSLPYAGENRPIIIKGFE